MLGPNPTKSDYVKEYFICKNDPYYFITKYVEIDIPGETIPLPMYDVQNTFLQSILTDHHVIALKSRQTGISTITQAYITYVHTFFKNIVVGIVSKDGAEATDFCRKVKSMLENLPAWVRPKYTKDTEQTYILENGSQFYAQAINPKNPSKLFRGKSITIAVMDEAAHADYIDEAWTGFGPALVKSQSIAKKNDLPYATIIISTPNGTTGLGKWYYESWKDAQESDSIYKPHTIHWKMVPEFANDPDWYKDQCRILRNNEKKILQELELKFISSDVSFFSPETISVLNECHKEPIKTIKMLKSNLLIWELPNRVKFYYIGIDTASSHGGDKSTIEVIDYETLQQVAEYRGKLRISDEFTKIVAEVADMYANNLIIVENNSYGETIAEYLTSPERRHKYNVYSSKYKYGAKDIVWGLCNTGKSRPLMIDSLYTYIEEDPTIVKSKHLALELIGLEENQRGKVEAGKGVHDDLALAYSFCTYVRMYDPKARRTFAPRHQIHDQISSIVDLNDDTKISLQSEMDKRKEEDPDNFDLTTRNRILRKYIKSGMDENEELKLEDVMHGRNNEDDADFTDLVNFID